MKCDVVVLGAGPAGLAAAIGCAAAGLSVRVLDRYTFPRSSVGEAVHPGAEALFDQLGVAGPVRKAGFVRHTGIWVQRQSHREFVPFGETSGRPWQGFQLWRPDFDQTLLDRAKDLGCEFVSPCTPSEAIPSGRGVSIVSTAGTFEARIVVDATGRSRWLARRWGLRIHRFSPTLVARYEYAEGCCSDLDDNPVFVTGSNGWEWIARVRENLYQRIVLRYAQGKQGLRETRTSFEGLHTVGRSRGADVTWTLVERSASLRHFIVGDAAAVLDPSSSHGILRALASGMLAGNCVLKILGNEGSSGDAAVAGYAAWQWNWFLRDVNRLRTANASPGFFRLPRTSSLIPSGVPDRANVILRVSAGSQHP